MTDDSLFQISKDRLALYRHMLEGDFFPKKIRNYFEPFLGDGYVWSHLAGRVEGAGFLGEPNRNIHDFWAMPENQYQIAVSILKSIDEAMATIRPIKGIHELSVGIIAATRKLSPLIHSTSMRSLLVRHTHELYRKWHDEAEHRESFNDQCRAVGQKVIFSLVKQNWNERMNARHLSNRYMGLRVALWYALAQYGHEEDLLAVSDRTEMDISAPVSTSLARDMERLSEIRDEPSWENAELFRRDCQASLEDATMHEKDFLFVNAPFEPGRLPAFQADVDNLERLCRAKRGMVAITISAFETEIVELFLSRGWHHSVIKTQNTVMLRNYQLS